MQSPIAGFRINELPKYLVDYPDEKSHAIMVDDPLSPNEPLIMPLVFKGFTSYLLYMKPIAG